MGAVPDKWVDNYRAGMAAGAAARAAIAPVARERSIAQREIAKANRARSLANPCVVPGCKRARYKGRLCKGHWDMAPFQAKVALSVAVMDAQVKVAAKHHRRIERDLLAALRDAAA